MKLCDVTRKIKWIAAAELLVLLAGIVLTGVMSGSLWMTALVGALLFILCMLSYIQYRIEDDYISGIVQDLSKLCDNLITLEEKTLFPENEDNLLSKLQNRILKLVKILKNNSKESEQAHENIKSLVSDISHQLKTPIANLKMYVEFLDDKDLTREQQKEYTDVIRQSVERLNFLSESMIKISRLESGLIHLQPEMQSLQETVMISLKDVYVKAREKDVEIRYEGDPIEVLHDRRWTAEAVFNLLENAVKYSDGPSVVSVSIRRFGLFAAVEVADENMPVQEQERTKIFTRFYRGANSKRSEGIGIGLYLAREIALKQGGYMNLKVSDKGNIFSVVLPCGR